MFKKPFFIDLVDSMTLNIKSKIFSNKEKIKQIFWNFEYRSIINFESAFCILSEIRSDLENSFDIAILVKLITI